LAPGVEIVITLERNRNEVLINSALSPKPKLYIDIIGVELHIPRITVRNFSNYSLRLED
jgi:hypothetical protein